MDGSDAVRAAHLDSRGPVSNMERRGDLTPDESVRIPVSAASALDRDIRLDACRGVALWFIFLDHIPDNIGSWLTLRHYGFSDTTEVFMFVSGVTCALAYSRVQLHDGWFAVVSHTLRRSWQIYAAFLILIIACVVMVHLAGDGAFADETNTRVLLELPGSTLAHAAILQYRAVNTDVLPTFVVYHLLFAPLLWLLFRSPNVALGASLLLYVLVRIWGWNLPQWPTNDWYFNPFAWQLLVVLGAWWAMGGRERSRLQLTSRIATSLASIYLVFGLVVALSWSIKPLEAAIPPLLAKLIYPIDKSDLDPLQAAALSGDRRSRYEIRSAQLAWTYNLGPAWRNSLRRELP